MKATTIDNGKDLAGIIDLLKESKLPYEDIILDGNLFVSYENEGDGLLGAGGLEIYNAYALLRSVVVSTKQRNKNYGKEIVVDLLDRAKKLSVKKVYLLTETAPDFFKNLGFRIISRDEVPALVKASSEFTTVCPVSAVCMEFELG